MRGAQKDKLDLKTATMYRRLPDDDDHEVAADGIESPSPEVSYIQLFRFLRGNEHVFLLLGIVASWLSAVCFQFHIICLGNLTFVMLSYQAKAVVVLTNTSVNLSTADKEELVTDVNKYVAGLVLVAVVHMVLGYAMSTCLNSTAERQMQRLKKRYLKSLLRQDLAWHDRNMTDDFANRVAVDLNRVHDGTGEKMGVFNYHIAVFFINYFSAFVHEWKLAGVMVSLTPVLVAICVLLAKVNAAFSRKEAEANDQAAAVVEQAIGAIRTVVAFGGGARHLNKHESFLRLACRRGIVKSLYLSLITATLWFTTYATFALAFWYGVGMIIDDPHGQFDPATLIIVFQSVFTGSMQMARSFPFLETVSQAKASATKVFGIIDRVPSIDSLGTNGQKLKTLRGSIEFDDVVFHYPARPDVPVLNGFNLKVKPGEMIVLFGESGSGKSSVIRLLQRLYDPQQGQVKIDGHDVRKLNVKWLRRHIGVVGQEPVLFGATIAENIYLGMDKGVATMDQVEWASKQANVHDFIMSLPLKYDTPVGEGGTQLSGGQKQRVAIARALIRQPRILVLDEATSALDAENEVVVQTALEQARLGRTTVVISHRLAGTKGADKIGVISCGRIVEIGTHEQLVATRGLYHQTYYAPNPVSSQSKNEAASPPAVDKLQMVDDDDDGLGKFTNGRTGHRSLDVTFPTDSESQSMSSSFFKVLKYNEPEWAFNVGGCATSFLLTLSVPAFVSVYGNIIELLSSLDEDATTIRRKLLLQCFNFLALGIAIALASFLQDFLFSVAGQRLTKRLRRLSFAAILQQKVEWFDQSDNSTGALCTRLAHDPAKVHGATGRRIGIIVHTVSTLTVTMIISVVLCWRLALVSFIFVPILLLAIYASKKIGKTQLSEKANKVACEAVANVWTVASLRGEEHFMAKYNKELRRPHSVALRTARLRGLVYGIIQVVPYVAQAACAVYTSHLLIHAAADYDTLFKVAQMVLLGSLTSGDAIVFSPNYTEGISAADRIFELLQSTGDGGGVAPTPRPRHDSVAGRPIHVEFRGVRFCYPSRPDVTVLDGLNLSIPRGSTVALVGHSGCGKSTILQLLLKLYKPTAGQVIVDAEDIADVDAASLRQQMGIVSQEPSLFDDTIAENIAYGGAAEYVSRDRVIQAASEADIHRFIMELPLGYETMVGKRGSQLSGGQKQRIALARVLIRNPDILLLDEATSSLDPEGERVVQEAIDRDRKGRTCILVSHRLTTVRNADLIAVIERGQIVELGSHDQLVAVNAHYNRFLQTQLTQQ